MLSLADQVIEKAGYVGETYHQLVLLVLPFGGGKTSVLLDVANRTSWLYVNVNLELSRRLLELTDRQRVLRLPALLDDTVSGAGSNPVLLDNLELLFDQRLRQDPLRLLQSLARRRTVIAAWGGHIAGGYLTYAEPDHADYRRYPAAELNIVGPQPTIQPA